MESFGDPEARLLVVGLAPGLKGANRTGRPFTGDYAGDLLYETLGSLGLARGTYERRPDDGLSLADCAIVNAVRCVPPQNKPTPQEIANCRTYLRLTIASLPKLQTIVALGRIAHDSVLRALDRRLSAHPFAHGARHDFETGAAKLFDSYHCSRYNTNTGVLTPAMFRDVLRAARDSLAALTINAARPRNLGGPMSAKAFGQIDGAPVLEVEIGSDAGARAKILTYGAVLRDLRIPVGGALQAVTLGLNSIEDYVHHSPSFGAVPGRFANRIAHGRFSIDGVEYTLDRNFIGKHTLHGGAKGFGKRIWKLGEHDSRSVSLSLVSDDGDMGFPGRNARDRRLSLR